MTGLALPSGVQISQALYAWVLLEEEGYTPEQLAEILGIPVEEVPQVITWAEENGKR